MKIVLFAIISVLASLSEAATAHFRYDVPFILSAVAQRKGITLRPEVALPQVLLASTTPFSRYQDEIEPQWGMRPEVFTNAYAVATNDIFLIDDASYYERAHRCIDDSLAHELTHYLQVKYQGITLDEFTDTEESEAVEVQTWFRENYCR